jgi:hypothetical protein
MSAPPQQGFLGAPGYAIEGYAPAAPAGYGELRMLSAIQLLCLLLAPACIDLTGNLPPLPPRDAAPGRAARDAMERPRR